MKLIFDTHGNEKQKEVARLWNDRGTKDILYGGSKGSGKSYLGASLIFGSAFLYPDTMWFIARKSLNDIRKFTIPTIYRVFKDWGLPREAYRHDGKDNFFLLYNGSKVFLLEAPYLPSDPLFERFGSIQMTGGWIEEAGEFTLAAKNALHGTIGRWKNEEYGLLPGKLLQTCNPSKNYLYKDYYKAFKEGKLPDWRRFIQAFPEDNKMLDAGYLENLWEIFSKAERERLLLGNWEYDDDPAALIEYDKILDMFTNSYVPTGKSYITGDPARFGRDKSIIVEWSGWRGKIHKYTKQGTDVTAQKIEEIRMRIGAPKSQIIVDEDGIGGGIVDFYKCKGFVNNSRAIPSPVNPQKGPDGKVIPENYDNIKSQLYFYLADLINAGKVYIECSEEDKQMIVEELEQVKQKDIDSDGKKGVVAKELVKAILGRSPDFADAIMLRAYFDVVKQSHSYAVSVESR